MVLWREAPHLMAGGRLWRWSFGDYGEPEAVAADAQVVALTPPSILAALAGGFTAARGGDAVTGLASQAASALCAAAFIVSASNV